MSKMYFKGYVCDTGCMLSKGNAKDDDIQSFEGIKRVIIKCLQRNFFSHKPNYILSQFIVKFLSPKIPTWSYLLREKQTILNATKLPTLIELS